MSNEVTVIPEQTLLVKSIFAEISKTTEVRDTCITLASKLTLPCSEVRTLLLDMVHDGDAALKREINTFCDIYVFDRTCIGVNLNPRKTMLGVRKAASRCIGGFQYAIGETEFEHKPCGTPSKECLEKILLQKKPLNAMALYAEWLREHDKENEAHVAAGVALLKYVEYLRSLAKAKKVAQARVKVEMNKILAEQGAEVEVE